MRSIEEKEEWIRMRLSDLYYKNCSTPQNLINNLIDAKVMLAVANGFIGLKKYDIYERKEIPKANDEMERVK